MTFPPFLNSDHVAISVFIDFLFAQVDAPFHYTTFNCSLADCSSFHNQISNVPWKDIFKLGAFVVVVEICGRCIQIGLNVYMYI